MANLDLNDLSEQKEFEEARKELQTELDKGLSLDEIKKKIIKGEVQTKVSKQVKSKSYFQVERIQHKKRDLMQLLRRHMTEWTEEKTPPPIEKTELTAVENFAKLKEEKDGGSVLNKKIYRIADKQLLVRN